MTRSITKTEIKEAKEFVKDLLAHNRISLRILDNRTRYTRGVWSQYFKGSYQGNVDEVERALVKFVREWRTREKLADTSASRMIRDACAHAFGWKALGMIVGRSGVGKTETVLHLEQEREEIIVIECNRAMRPTEVFVKILQQLDEVHTTHASNGAKVSAIIWALQRKERLLIFDEADQLTPYTLDVVRRIFDDGNCGMILQGMPALEDMIARGRNLTKVNLDYLFSRVTIRREIPPPSSDDIRKILSLYNADISQSGMKVIRKWISHRGELRVLTNTLDYAVSLVSKSNGEITDDILERAYSKLQGFE